MIDKFDREKSDFIFTETLEDIDNLNTRDGKFEYSDYVTLHNDVTTLYDSFACVDEIMQLLTSRTTKAESENKQLRAEIDITDAANTALEGALKQAEAERDAAIADMRPKDNCDICKYTREGVEDCVTYDWDCAVCKSTKCVCRVCRNESKWQWRGLQGGDE